MVSKVRELFEAGLSKNAISRETGVSRSVIRDWVGPQELRVATRCPASAPGALPSLEYTYLLGLYLGDGCISTHRRGVERLRISCASIYPNLMDECEKAMFAVLPNKVGRVQERGCVSVNNYAKHWSCLLPQHGAGRKHDRKITLELWQQEMVNAEPWAFLRGLIHSDGCRSLNTVNGKGYVRYTFSNKSDDIKRLFTDTLDLVGVEWKRMNAMNISVARRASVELMDRYIGPKS